MGALGRSCGCRTAGAQAGLAPGHRMCCRGPERASRQVPGAGSGGAVPGRSSFISTQGLAPEQSRDLGKPLEMAQPSQGPGRHWKKPGSGGSPWPALPGARGAGCCAQPSPAPRCHAASGTLCGVGAIKAPFHAALPSVWCARARPCSIWGLGGKRTHRGRVAACPGTAAAPRPTAAAGSPGPDWAPCPGRGAGAGPVLQPWGLPGPRGGVEGP